MTGQKMTAEDEAFMQQLGPRLASFMDSPMMQAMQTTAANWMQEQRLLPPGEDDEGEHPPAGEG
jgi:hypothetical protein